MLSMGQAAQLCLMDQAQCYAALVARDPRFDGRFFVGVSTTGIYCRPICPAKTPRQDRCTFYATAPEAEVAGYRPCLRCRPELAPGLAKIDRPDRLASAAVRRIETGFLVESDLKQLAGELGISDRHLRRVVQDAYGVAPIELALTHRLHAAKQLLTDTGLSIGEAAFASGFKSVRRFNEAFQSRYRLRPTDIRKRASADHPEQIEIQIGYRPPHDLDSMFGYFGSRAIAGIEVVSEGRYARTVRIGETSGWLSVAPDPIHPRLRVRVSRNLGPKLPGLLRRIRHQFDTEANMDPILDVLGEIAIARPGLRIPGSFDAFETIVRVVLGQQVSVAAANTLAGRLAKAFGERIETPFPGVDHLFPTPQQLASVEVSELSALGITRTKVKTIQVLANRFHEDPKWISSASTLAEATDRLDAIAGIGPWTIQVVALKVLRWPDAFMATDLGIRKAMNLDDPKQAELAAEKWRPWRAYAAMHLWRQLEP